MHQLAADSDQVGSALHDNILRLLRVHNAAHRHRRDGRFLSNGRRIRNLETEGPLPRFGHGFPVILRAEGGGARDTTRRAIHHVDPAGL